RDSLHCGVPYGSHFDAARLVASLEVDPMNDCLAIGRKGRTAAELMVFARYVMFSEVYWHHAVRSATAMLQRSIYDLRHRLDFGALCDTTDAGCIAMLRRAAEGSFNEPMIEGIFGPRRQLFKRVLDIDAVSDSSAISPGNAANEIAGLHRRVSRKPFWWLVAASEQLAVELRRRTGLTIASADVLIDAPPPRLEVNVDIPLIADSRLPTTDNDNGQVLPTSAGMLGDISPIVRTLANHQFDSNVKRVRVFVRPSLRDAIRAKCSENELQTALANTASHLDETMC
ncbi:MAG: hypothetical protein AAFN70_06920, partial [Planctomycetota bacterium]